MKRAARARKTVGFTLVELAIVLAVVSILAAVVVPDFIEVARNDLAEQSAREVGLILDTAKWYYSNSATWNDQGDFRPGAMRWPGDRVYPPDYNENGANAAEDCLRGLGTALGAGNLPDGTTVRINCDIAYLPASALVNPWDQPYEINLVPQMQGINVATNVPRSVAGVLRSFVPGGECEAGFNGGTAPQYCFPLTPRPAGYATCCSTIPRPGREASFEEMVTEVTPEASSAATCENEMLVPDGGGCDDGYVARGIKCASKECGDPDTICCQVVE